MKITLRVRLNEGRLDKLELISWSPYDADIIIEPVYKVANEYNIVVMT